MRKLSAIERFFTKIEVRESGCWQWMGTLFSTGYGEFWDGVRRLSAHRFAFAYFQGCALPEYEPKSLQLDHLCRNRRCVNPNHLELVTPQENVLRGNGPASQNARKTHCLRGHPFDAQNTYILPDGRRACRICRRIFQFRYRRLKESRNR